jgi:DNA-binding helix-hairpin-helix protein with protein kinase domain
LPGGDLVPLLGAPPRHWLLALRALLAAVQYLHDRGFAHRDLKARNVLFAADGSLRVIDLASACAVDAPGGIPAGATAAHLPADPAVTACEADRFALAVLVYELVTGRLPFGVGGARAPGARPALAAANDVVGARLAAVAGDILGANGRAAWGLSALADVIESAAAPTVESER